MYPWAFYLGGKFHITPYWQGWGKLHAKSGEYVLFVRIQPTAHGSRMYAHSNLRALAYLCTPRAEQLRLHLGGTMRPRINLSTDGEAIDLYMDLAFQPDGTVYRGQGRNLSSPEIVPLILIPGSYADFKEACATTSA